MVVDDHPVVRTGLAAVIAQQPDLVLVGEGESGEHAMALYRLGDELVREGHRLRIYTPFGRQWYSYSLRRLQENPKLAGFVAADTLRRFRVPGF
jgi:hypothetical protein